MATKKSNAGPPRDLLDGRDDELAPGDLLLDPGNFRLIEVVEQAVHEADANLIGQEAIQARVFNKLREADSFEVSALVRSIVKNGFLNHEKLIVAPYDGKRYVVLEGNRRLTAVLRLIREPRLREQVPAAVQRTYEDLPCFVLEGDPIDGDDKRLREYRRHAAIYVGMRHLMRAKQWSPPGRYEFQARLVLQDGWKIKEVADHFGSTPYKVTNELKAQVLYHDFAEYRRKNEGTIPLTYNAFAEMSKSPHITRWLDWNTRERRVQDKTREHAVFDYLTSRLAAQAHRAQEGADREEVEAIQRITAEKIVRNLRDMLKLEDNDISAALEENDFARAELLYEDRRAGVASARVRDCLKTLQRLSVSDLKQDAVAAAPALATLITMAEDLKQTAEAFVAAQA